MEQQIEAIIHSSANRDDAIAKVEKQFGKDGMLYLYEMGYYLKDNDGSYSVGGSL